MEVFLNSSVSKSKGKPSMNKAKQKTDDKWDFPSPTRDMYTTLTIDCAPSVKSMHIDLANFLKEE